MNKSQIRFAMAAHAAWLVIRNPVLTRVYMKQWEALYPRPMSVDGEELLEGREGMRLAENADRIFFCKKVKKIGAHFCIFGILKVEGDA